MWGWPAQPIMLSMFNDNLLRTLSETRAADARRDVRQHSEARGGPAPRPIRGRVSQRAPLTIRHATAADFPALERLAALDSRRIPTGELFVAEAEGRLLAATSLDTGAVIADPFEHTASIVELLRAHVSAIRPAAPRPVAVPDSTESTVPATASLPKAA
jgi:hypothetical protein